MVPFILMELLGILIHGSLCLGDSLCCCSYYAGYIMLGINCTIVAVSLLKLMDSRKRRKNTSEELSQKNSSLKAVRKIESLYQTNVILLTEVFGCHNLGILINNVYSG